MRIIKNGNKILEILEDGKVIIRISKEDQSSENQELIQSILSSEENVENIDSDSDLSNLSGEDYTLSVFGE